MDKKYQDIFYLKCSQYQMEYDEVVFGKRQVRILTISFGTCEIKIDYCEPNGKYDYIILKKKPYHKLVIE